MHNGERLVKDKRNAPFHEPCDAAQRDCPGPVSVRSELNCDCADRNFRRDNAWRRQHSTLDGDTTGWSVASCQQHAGESINDVTDNLAIDALCGTAAFNGTLVEVEATK
jgi:hypothetical protein